MAKKQNPEDYLAIKDIMQEQLDILKQQEDKANKISAGFKDQISLSKSAATYQKKIVEQLVKAKDTTAEEKIIQKSIVEIMTNKKRLSAAAKKTILEGLNNRMKELAVQKKQAEGLKRMDAAKAKALKDQQDAAKELTNSVDGFVDSIESSVQSIPFLGGFLAKKMGFDKLREDFKKDVVANMGNGFKGLTTSVATLGKSVLKAVAPFAPLLIVLALIKKAFDFDKEVTALSRNLGISRDAAMDMRVSFGKFAKDVSGVRVSELVKAQEELSNATGMSAQFSNDMLASHVKLVKFYGLTNKEASNLSIYTKSTGTNVEDLKKDAVKVVHQFNKATGTSINFRDVVKDISNLSEEIKVQFKGNNIELTKAVTLARAMGISLQESADAAEKTLSIEESLKNEMTLMVATGIQINNNAIRQAQVMGEPLEVLRLQKEQLLNIGDISGKLPHEQQLIAKAMGLSTSKLLEMNRNMVFQKQMGVELANATEEELRNSGLLKKDQVDAIMKDRERLSVQEKMAEVTEKIGELFMAIAPDIIEMVDAAILMVENMGGLKEILKTAGRVAVYLAAYLAFGALAGIPIAGPVLGGIAAVKIISEGLGAIDGVGDVMSPADGKTQVSTKEGGLFELSKNDDLMAAPGIFSGGGNGGGMNLSGLINEIKGLRSGLINEIKGLRRDIQTQPIQVTVDGRVVSAISKVQAQQTSVRTTGYGR
jgi:hypothetical protein